MALVYGGGTYAYPYISRRSTSITPVLPEMPSHYLRHMEIRSKNRKSPISYCKPRCLLDRYAAHCVNTCILGTEEVCIWE